MTHSLPPTLPLQTLNATLDFLCYLRFLIPLLPTVLESTTFSVYGDPEKDWLRHGGPGHLSPKLTWFLLSD